MKSETKVNWLKLEWKCCQESKTHVNFCRPNIFLYLHLKNCYATWKLYAAFEILKGVTSKLNSQLTGSLTSCRNWLQLQRTEWKSQSAGSWELKSSVNVLYVIFHKGWSTLMMWYFMRWDKYHMPVSHQLLYISFKDSWNLIV